MASISKEEARKELARRELERRGSGGGEASFQEQRGGQKSVGEALRGAEGISQSPGPIKRGVNSAIGRLAEIGQTVGGVGGAIAGSRVGRPAVGSAIGGTAGRTMGRFLNLAATGRLGDLTSAEKKDVGKEILATAGTEAVLAPVTAFAGGAGKGALEALLGPRVAERGLKKGFKRLLDPKFFQDRFPKEIALKTRGFFNKLDGVTGRGVSREVNKHGNKFVSIKAIQDQEKQILKSMGAETIEDLGSATVSKAQISKAKEAQKLIGRFKRKSISIPKLWETRKEFDKIRFRHSFDKDIERYLDAVRTTMNAPIKGASKDVAKAFGRYSSVKELEKDMGKKFKATLIDDEIFTPKTEQFANTLLGTSKDETVRALQKLDSFLNAEDRVIEDLLDVAATESLGKTIEFMGVAQRSIVGGLGGKRAIAGGAKNLQSVGGQALRKLTNRGLAVGGTNISAPQQQ